VRDEVVSEFKMLDVAEPGPLESVRVIPNQCVVSVGADVQKVEVPDRLMIWPAPSEVQGLVDVVVVIGAAECELRVECRLHQGAVTFVIRLVVAPNKRQSIFGS
jgi:hypothetical protein